MSVLLQYEFSVGSLQSVSRAFKSIEGMAAQEAKNEVRARERTMRSATPRLSKAVVDPQKKALEDLSKFGQTRMRQELAERQRLDKRAHDARIRMIDRERREAVAAERARDRVRRATIGTTATSAIRSTVGVGKAILGATGLAGGAIAASRIGPGIDLQHQQRELLRAGRAAGSGYTVSEKELAGRVSSASIATGASQQDVTAGAHAYVEKTGDLKGALDNLQTFATVAQATGASVEDIGSAAADLSQKFDIKTTQGMADALAMLAFQGKKGAFEIKNMAAEFPVLASAAANAGMRGESGVKNLGGLIQIATVGAGKEQATTALVDAFTELSKHAGELEAGKLGKRVGVFEKGRGIGHGEVQRNFGDVIQEVIGAAHGDMTKIEPIFGLRGIKAINPLIGAYQKADIAAGGGKSGDAAGRAAIAAMIQENVEAGGTFKEVQIDAAHALQDTSAQLEILNTKLQDAVDSKLLPALTNLIPKIEPLIPQFADLLGKLSEWIGWLAEHPAEGIGLAIIGSITKDIAAAQIGPAVAAAIAGAITAARGAQAAGGLAAGLAGLSGGAAAGGGLVAGGRAAVAGLFGSAAGAGGVVGGSLLGLGVAAAGAGAATYGAYKSNEALKDVAGGHGALDALASIFTGKGSFFEQINAEADAQAKAARAHEDAAAALKDSAVAIKGAAAAMQPGAPPTGTPTPNRGADPTAARL